MSCTSSLPLRALSSRQKPGGHRLPGLLLLFLATGCADCDQSRSYVRADAADVGHDLAEVAVDPGDTGSDTPLPTDMDLRADVPPDASDTGRDMPPDLGLPTECPWALSGCVALSPTDPADCGPLGCGLAAPATLWVDALPCLRPVQVTPPSGSPWRVLNPGVQNGAVAFELVADGLGQTFCILDPQGITFYPETLTCTRDGDVPWTTSVGMHAEACVDCPRVHGCYLAEGFDPPHAVALFQEGCTVTTVVGERLGRTLPQVGAVGPDGQLIFREIGQVADSICGLAPGPAGGYDGFACAHSQVGLPGDIEVVDDVRLTPAPWSDCPFVNCVEDADCARHPDGDRCVRGRCAGQ